MKWGGLSRRAIYITGSSPLGVDYVHYFWHESVTGFGVLTSECRGQFGSNWAASTVPRTHKLLQLFFKKQKKKEMKGIKRQTFIACAAPNPTWQIKQGRKCEKKTDRYISYIMASTDKIHKWLTILSGAEYILATHSVHTITIQMVHFTPENKYLTQEGKQNNKKRSTE